MNNENKPSVIAELTAALASMAERAATAEAEAEQYKKSSGEWYQFFTSKDKELRDTQAELQKARKALEAKEGEQNHGNSKGNGGRKDGHHPTGTADAAAEVHQVARSRSLYHPEGPQRRRKVQVREDLRRVPASHSGHE